jgi:hypothetical protein
MSVPEVEKNVGPIKSPVLLRVCGERSEWFFDAIYRV